MSGGYGRDPFEGMGAAVWGAVAVGAVVLVFVAAVVADLGRAMGCW